MKTFFETASMQNHPLRAVSDFLIQEAASEQAQKYEEMLSRSRSNMVSYSPHICPTYTAVLEPWSPLIVRPADSMDSYTVSRSSRC